MEYRVVGLMSGTSGDGLDVALCSFRRIDGTWNFKICFADTVPFPEDIRILLEEAYRTNGLNLVKSDFSFGAWCGDVVKRICDEHNFIPVLVASHGHTLFHNPHEGYTLQIGNGPSLASRCGFPVVYDFRSADVAKGGQGAPLVPVGDHLLFPHYSFCLNIGGIANVSAVADNVRIAYDIVPVNIVLNALAQRTGLMYDDAGSMAASGTMIPEIFEKLEQRPYYQTHWPKSLTREWVEEEIFPLLDQKYPVSDLLHTYTLHAARQIALAVGNGIDKSLLVTGGGTYNLFLRQQIARQTTVRLVIPAAEIIEFKEALVFAFLGLLRWLGEINVYKTVTGAKNDHCAGSVVLP